MKINHILAKVVEGVEIGDIFHIEETGTYLQIIDLRNGKLGLLDLSESEMESMNINHAVHAVNHVKKYYGEFKLIKNSQVSINIETS